MSLGTPAPPPQGVPATPSSCPKCNATVDPSAKFCPACGASLPGRAGPASASASAAPGSAPVDIRQRVDQDRGVLKRLQLLIPGFRGYRQGEDLREADSVLRLQVADKVKAANAQLTQRRQDMAMSGRFTGLNDLALAIADLNRLEGEIRHAEQGYTGFSPAVRVSLPSQDKLYEYDYGFALAADDLQKAAAALAGPSSDPSGDAAAVATIRSLVTRLEQAFKARILVIQQVKVA
jgi:hypothetical protein